MRSNYCRGVISLQEPLPHTWCISLDLHGILAIVWTPVYSVVSICVCRPPTARVYNIMSSSLLHRKYLLLLSCLLKVSKVLQAGDECMKLTETHFRSYRSITWSLPCLCRVNHAEAITGFTQEHGRGRIGSCPL